MNRLQDLTLQQREKLLESYEEGKLTAREFLDRATEGLFRKKREQVEARHVKYFKEKMLG